MLTGVDLGINISSSIEPEEANFIYHEIACEVLSDFDSLPELEENEIYQLINVFIRMDFPFGVGDTIDTDEAVLEFSYQIQKITRE